MKHCIVKIHKSPISGNYVQNNFELTPFDSLEEVNNNIKKILAIPLSSLVNSENKIIDDIRGNIINERGEIYGYVDANDHPHYFSIVVMNEDRRNNFLK
jgi:hypothetical protein